MIFVRFSVHWFGCRFDLSYYPFDTQKCSIDMAPPENSKGYVEFVPRGVEFMGNNDNVKMEVGYDYYFEVLIEG